jgi:hypothetical protein
VSSSGPEPLLVGTRGRGAVERRRDRRLWLLLVLVAGTLFLATPAQASIFGHWYLDTNQCCGSDPLKGTRASIRTPTTSSGFSIPSHCALFRSDAENDSGKQIQVGFVKCGPNWTLDGSCSVSNNLVKYVELRLSSGYACYSKGSVGYGNDSTYSAVKVATGTWRTYIEGVAQTPDYSWGGSAVRLIEGGEYTGSTSNDSFTASGRYGISRVWGRSNGSSWVTVTSAFQVLGTGWTISGGPDGAWTVNHP